MSLENAKNRLIFVVMDIKDEYKYMSNEELARRLGASQDGNNLKRLMQSVDVLLRELKDI